MLTLLLLLVTVFMGASFSCKSNPSKSGKVFTSVDLQRLPKNPN